MYKKTFYIMIDEDLFPFYSINIQEDDTMAENSLHQTLLSALSNDPVVVELSGITPALGTRWDGSSFENFTNEPISTETEYTTGMKHYSLVVDGRHSQYLGVSLSSQNGEMITSALSSNPKIVGRISVR